MLHSSVSIHHHYDLAGHFHVCGLFCECFLPFFLCLLLIFIIYIAAFHGVLHASKALLIVTFLAAECASFLSPHGWFFCKVTSILVHPAAHPHISFIVAFHSRIPSDSLHFHNYFSIYGDAHIRPASASCSMTLSPWICCHSVEVFIQCDIQAFLKVAPIPDV